MPPHAFLPSGISPQSSSLSCKILRCCKQTSWSGGARADTCPTSRAAEQPVRFEGFRACGCGHTAIVPCSDVGPLREIIQAARPLASDFCQILKRHDGCTLHSGTGLAVVEVCRPVRFHIPGAPLMVVFFAEIFSVHCGIDNPSPARHQDHLVHSSSART